MNKLEETINKEIKEKFPGSIIAKIEGNYLKYTITDGEDVYPVIDFQEKIPNDLDEYSILVQKSSQRFVRYCEGGWEL